MELLSQGLFHLRIYISSSSCTAQIPWHSCTEGGEPSPLLSAVESIPKTSFFSYNLHPGALLTNLALCVSF